MGHKRRCFRVARKDIRLCFIGTFALTAGEYQDSVGGFTAEVDMKRVAPTVSFHMQLRLA
jgi:hypothetical protein